MESPESTQNDVFHGLSPPPLSVHGLPRSPRSPRSLRSSTTSGCTSPRQFDPISPTSTEISTQNISPLHVVNLKSERDVALEALEGSPNESESGSGLARLGRRIKRELASCFRSKPKPPTKRAQLRDEDFYTVEVVHWTEQ